MSPRVDLELPIRAWSDFVVLLFFFNDTATTEIYTLSLHDALPICFQHRGLVGDRLERALGDEPALVHHRHARGQPRSEEHTSELQSRLHLVCRLLLEKKKKKLVHHTARKQEGHSVQHEP